MLQHATTELCNSMIPACQPSWTLTPVDVLIDRPTLLKVYRSFEAQRRWFRGLLTGSHSLVRETLESLDVNLASLEGSRNVEGTAKNHLS